MDKRKDEKKMKAEYDFPTILNIGKEMKNYAGEWISIVDNKIVAKWGTRGKGDGQFDNPTDISITPTISKAAPTPNTATPPKK